MALPGSEKGECAVAAVVYFLRNRRCWPPLRSATVEAICGRASKDGTRDRFPLRELDRVMGSLDLVSEFLTALLDDRSEVLGITIRVMLGAADQADGSDTNG